MQTQLLRRRKGGGKLRVSLVRNQGKCGKWCSEWQVMHREEGVKMWIKGG